MKLRLYLLAFLIYFVGRFSVCYSQIRPAIFENVLNSYSSPLRVSYIKPKNIVWQSTRGVSNAGKLLENNFSQPLLSDTGGLQLKGQAALILDFGCQLQGGLRITTTKNNKNPNASVRIRFGESVGEVNSNIGEKESGNDHAFRDITTSLPWLGAMEMGNTGFRFVRIDLLDSSSSVEIKEITAKFSYRDIEYKGSFRCNDDLLNKIWLTGAYTVHLNMQEFLWDGVKRDRLVWVGDMHPEVMTITSVFGKNDVVSSSLDLIRDRTPENEWMNGISSYSIWWILIQKDWYLYQGDLSYLKEQQDYLSLTLKRLSTKIGDNGKELLDGWRFLDWPSSTDSVAIHVGLQSLLKMAFEAGSYLATALKNEEMGQICRVALKKMSAYKTPIPQRKQAAALLALSDLAPPSYINNRILSKNGAEGISTFFGYYILLAQAKADDIVGAMKNIRAYWGGMIDLGATTFWEDFDINWMKNAARLDELPDSNKVDVHGAYGDFCYKGYRKSLCHGWASGPTAWLSEYVLGIIPLEPGMKKIKIAPNLGDLEWAEGTFPTPYGIIRVSHRKTITGTVVSKIHVPKGIKVIKN